MPNRSTRILVGSAMSGIGGLALAGKGAKDVDDARKQQAVADERYRSRLEESDRRRSEVNEAAMALGRLQENCLEAVVTRMSDFLRRHEKQVRESDRLFVDGVDATIQLLESPRVHDAADAVTWVAGAAGSVAAGAGTSVVATKLAIEYGVAGTGREISSLRGVAKDRAVKAFFGDGPKANGGGGIARGEKVLKAVMVGPGLLMAGFVTKVMGVKAKADAQQHTTTVEVWCADMDLADGELTAIEQLAEELSELLNQLSSAAVAQLDVLEAVPFDPNEHTEQLQRTLMLVLAVRDVAGTPLLTGDGEPNEQSQAMTVRYRPMVKEAKDD